MNQFSTDNHSLSQDSDLKNHPSAGKGVVGRFAPSPTGPLHQGSLVAAVASYAMARQTGGLWLLRIEDIDPPREVPGSAQDIIDTLDAFGFRWDGEIVYQSQQQQHYKKAFQSLRNATDIYPCFCSRKQIEQRNDGVYDGFCRDSAVSPPPGSVFNEDQQSPSWRMRFAHSKDNFDDGIYGHLRLDKALDRQDFVVKRRDGLFAYQLAVVVDDTLSGVNQVVRGADIIDSTPRQRWLLERLGWPQPDYYHLPLLLDENGQKLSKSKLAPALSMQEKAKSLIAALQHLQQSPPRILSNASCQDILDWTIEHFKVANIQP